MRGLDDIVALALGKFGGTDQCLVHVDRACLQANRSRCDVLREIQLHVLCDDRKFRPLLGRQVLPEFATSLTD